MRCCYSPICPLTFIFLFLTLIPSANAEMRRDPVSYHLPFENEAFFADDIIAQSGRTAAERKIDFPEGRFGKGIRMNHIPEPLTIETANGIDLDPTTAIVYNFFVGRNPRNFFEPAIWGQTRLNPRLGAIAFWAKGKPPYACRLFTQATVSFGRKERDLLAVEIDENGILSVFLRDARYVRHELMTNVVWNPDTWNHVVLNWDWANGLELWLNSQKIASSWGDDGWFETVYPGLFQLSAPGLIYDELYLLDRPLTPVEIKRLMAANTPPGNEPAVYTRKTLDFGRIARMSGADATANLPEVSPQTGLYIGEIYPTGAADGLVPGWYIIDGRTDMAWPHEYSFFTTTPGDADFHAEKVDITTPDYGTVNYVALTGNLTNVRVQAGSPDIDDVEDLFSVPSGDRFFHGFMIEATTGSVFRIPFTERYGCPPGFEGDVITLPLSGDKRIHTVGLYYVGAQTTQPAGEKYTISPSDGVSDSRYTFALHALTSRDERSTALAARGKSASKAATVDIGAFQRLHILSEPFETPTGVDAVTLTIPVKTSSPEEALFVRVHDPAVPSRMWNQFAVRLAGFDHTFGTLTLTIDFTDVVLTNGDRLWIDIGTAGSCQVKLGDANSPSFLIVTPIEVFRAVDAYADKEIVSARAQYTKQYEFMPWKLTRREVSLDKPDCYGGPFDMIMPALAILRVKPEHFIARYQQLMCGPTSRQIPVDGGGFDPSLVTLKTINDPQGAPSWAVYMREYLRYGVAVVDWWRARQNQDGQLGGGWNDDTLFIGHHQAYLPLDGCENARAIIDTVHTKIAATNYFKDGYCRIYPIDRLHTGDLVSERYTTVLNNLGQAFAAEREMETAWHDGHPERTPLNYGDGRAFRSSVNVLKWYWGLDVPAKPFENRPFDRITEQLRLFASVWTDYAFYRFTDSGVHRDDYRPIGSNEMYNYLLAGDKGARTDAHPNLAVMWPSGGGPEVARIVLRADDTSLDALCYSFDSNKHDLAMRLCRIQDGRYRVGLHADPIGNGNAGDAIWQNELDLRRFDVITLPVPPRMPLMIRLQQIKKRDRPIELPDLAIDPWDISRSGSTVSVTVHNIGNGSAEKIVVRLLDGEKTLSDTIIARLDAPVDFRPKHTMVNFTEVPTSRNLQVVIDPEGAIPEILEDNNIAAVR
ncbi:MAG: hypothetical protein JW795_00455 [Chitinivibrionales bacterium]|nr:hypothetical protein [Chitinivibrionales bacterium]